MKKLKKLFNLLPAFALAFISGLGAVLNIDQAPKPAYAVDMLPIYEKYANTTVSYTKTNYLFDPSRVYTNFITFDNILRVYRDLQNEKVSVIYTFTLPQTNVIYGYNVNTGTYEEKFTFNAPPYSTYAFSVDNLERISESDNDFNVTFNTIGLFNYQQGNAINGFKYSYDLQFGFTFTYNGYVTTRSVYVDHIELSTTSLNILSNDYLPNVLFNTTSSINTTLLSGTFNPDDYTQYEQGVQDGYNTGYQTGYSDGYYNGNQVGYDSGYSDGYSSGNTIGYNNGYADGLAYGTTSNGTAMTIFSGILQIGMLPVNILLAMFNFEILGINLSAFVSAILTVCLTIIVIRTIKGGGNSD